MTLEELRMRVSKMDTNEKEQFKKAIGASNQSDETVFANFRDGIWEPRICEYLGAPTESAKVAKATFDAAWYARAAFYATLVGLLIGIASITVAVWLAG
jgi:hypothetical protein